MLWVFSHTKKSKKEKKKKQPTGETHTHSITINNISSTCPGVLQNHILH